MNSKPFITLCYLTGYVIAPVLSILIVIGAMHTIRSNSNSTNIDTPIATTKCMNQKSMIM